MKEKLIVANWKMNSDFTKAEAWVGSFLSKSSSKLNVFENVTAVVCPPNIMIDEISANVLEYSFEKVDADLTKKGKNSDDITQIELAKNVDKYRVIKIGAQNCHSEKEGAYTGDVSAKMVAEIGCEYVIIGHSERRKYHYETNETVGNKIKAVVAQEMTPILCVGESKEVRDSAKYINFVIKQLKSCVPLDVKIENLVIAYEPIWAIGTGLVPTAEEISEMVSVVKKVCDGVFSKNVKSYSILYGGSVNVKNSPEILAVEDLDGLLIGNVSLNATDFFSICSLASL